MHGGIAGAVVYLVVCREGHFRCPRLDLRGHFSEGQGVVAMVIAGHSIAVINGHGPLADLAFSEAGGGGRHFQGVAVDEAREDEVADGRNSCAVIDLVLRRESDRNRLGRDRSRHIVGEVDGVVAIVIAGYGETVINGHDPGADLASSEAGRGSHLHSVACDKAKEAEVTHRRGGCAVVDLVVRREADCNLLRRDGGRRIVGEVD
ncbi:MAG: hypothetical protein BWX73_03082 [Lentisphaerae bacterium ADurb.Bin082]|nr:MAG: hypothetical protein BWX73_03082 [Lentisphaerae bacterium ADurb.Bin082]